MDKHSIQTSGAPAPIGPYNQAIRTGNLLFISGQIPMDAATNEIVTTGIEDATRKVMDNIGAILQAAGADFANIVKSSIFLTDLGQFIAVNEVYGQYFDADAPARECVQVAALPKGVEVEISVVAVLA